MELKTTEFLKKLEGLNWFCNVGKHQSIKSNDVAYISSWPAALNHYSSEDYEAAQTEAANELTSNLHQNYRDAYKMWNEKAAAIKSITDSLIDKKLQEAKSAGNITGEIAKAGLQWDILHICMHLEYADLVTTDYYTKLEHWYLAGHFPCGWEGDVPDDFEDAFASGKLLVF